jgi:hypothetical protein
MLRRERYPLPSLNSSSTTSLLSSASSSLSDEVLEWVGIGGVYGLGVCRIGWMKGCVGLKDPEPFDTDEHPLTVLECEVVLLLGFAEKETSLAVFAPMSCIPKPASPSFSVVDRDRSSFPWSSFELEVLRR